MTLVFVLLELKPKSGCQVSPCESTYGAVALRVDAQGRAAGRSLWWGLATVDLLQIGDGVLVEVSAPGRCVGRRCHRRRERSRGPVVQVGRRRPDVAQGGRVDARQRRAETLAARRLLDRADVLQVGRGAVGEGLPAVALARNRVAGRWSCRPRPLVVSVPSGVAVADCWRSVPSELTYAASASRSALTPAFGSPSGWLRVPVLKLRVGHEAGAAGQAANLAFEVLDLVEVGAPVQESLRAGTAAQAPPCCAVPRRGRSDPRPGRHDRRRCGSSRSSCSAPSPGACRSRRRRTACPSGQSRVRLSLTTACSVASSGATPLAPFEQVSQVVDTPTVRSMKLMHVQPIAVRRQGQRLAARARRRCGTTHRGCARRSRRPRGWSPARRRGTRRKGRTARRSPGSSCRGRCATRYVSAPGRQVDARADCAHRVLEVEIAAAAKRATLDVVLLRRHPCRRAIRGDHRRSEVVGHAAARILEVRIVAVTQHDRVDVCQGGRIDHHHFTAALDATDLGDDIGRFLAGQATA